MRKWIGRVFLICLMMWELASAASAQGTPLDGTTTTIDGNGVITIVDIVTTTENNVSTQQVTVTVVTSTTTAATYDVATGQIDVLTTGGISTEAAIALGNAVAELTKPQSGDVFTNETSTIEYGQLGYDYGDGKIAGFYEWPVGSGQQYPISLANKNKAIRQWAAKGMHSFKIVCPDNSNPDWSDPSEIWDACTKWEDRPIGDRTRVPGRSCERAWMVTEVTDLCVLKCQDLGTKFNGVYKHRCSRDGDVCTSFLVSYTCDPIGISGHVYYDENNSCSTEVGWNKSSGLKVGVQSTAYDTAHEAPVAGLGAVDPGSYLINVPVRNNWDNLRQLDLTVPDGYMCSPACSGCPTKVGVASRSVGNNFFLTSVNTPKLSWWQTVGAGIYAGNEGGGMSVQSLMPSNKQLILPGSTGAMAALLRVSGTVDLGQGIVSTEGYSAKTKYKGKKMDYAYFASNMGLIKGRTSDWASDILDLPTYDSTKDLWYSIPTGGPAKIETDWIVGTGEKYVIFVNGDLEISNKIQVAEGGFLAFIVSGKITVSPAVTTLQGIYMTNKDFVTASNPDGDIALDVQGNVIAWGVVDLNRDLGAANATTAAETFTFRVDIIENMPDKMKTFAMQWSEVVSGTYGE